MLAPPRRRKLHDQDSGRPFGQTPSRNTSHTASHAAKNCSGSGSIEPAGSSFVLLTRRLLHLSTSSARSSVPLQTPWIRVAFFRLSFGTGRASLASSMVHEHNPLNLRYRALETTIHSHICSLPAESAFEQAKCESILRLWQWRNKNAATKSPGKDIAAAHRKSTHRRVEKTAIGRSPARSVVG